MPNRILNVDVQTRRADPVGAELLVSVTAAEVNVATEVRGRCVGPKCEGRSTIEVAYPLRHVPGPKLTARVVIPEPSLWSQTHLLVYDFVVELWQDGKRCDERTVTGYRVVPPLSASR